ncbi:C39 family peptidase [Paenibacillus ferrarius]|uniref:C39 family peptidase n=1 Tax=Paenibacillus ferrarius TaxID=1469647 RepID=UPI003D28D8E8
MECLPLRKITLSLLGLGAASLCVYVAESVSLAGEHIQPPAAVSAAATAAASRVALAADTPVATATTTAGVAHAAGPAAASAVAGPAEPAQPAETVPAPATGAAVEPLRAIPALSQLPELPNGCEAVAATMLLNWAGLPISKEDVAAALPKGELPYTNEDGAVVGGNPRDVFVGDPFDVGYGIYHAPIAALMQQWLPGRIEDVTGIAFASLLELPAKGRPVMVWATEHMDMPYLDLEWEDPDGELVEWYQPEHALLLVGSDDEYAYLNDPMTGRQEAYSLDAFEQAWEAMGSQAITARQAKL